MKTRRPIAIGLLAASSILTLLAPLRAQSTYTWTATTGSPAGWGTTGNWSGGLVGGLTAGDVVLIQSDITAAYTINMNANRTLGNLVLGDANSTHGFTLAQGSASSLILDQVGTATASVQFPAGTSNSISAPVILNDDARIYATSPTINVSQTLSGIISGSGRSLTFDNDDGAFPAGPNATAGIFVLSGANTFSGGTTIDDVRVAGQTSASAFGTGPVTVLDGGQAWVNLASTFANNFTITGGGWGSSAGGLGAIRMLSGSTISGTVTITGTPGDSGGTTPDAAIMPVTTSSSAASGTISGVVSGGDLMIGTPTEGTNTAWTGNETVTLTAANTYGDSIVRALDTANTTSGQTTLVIGGNVTNTVATLGTGNVYLSGGALGKIAAVRIQRGGGYTLQQDVLSVGTGPKTALIVDVTGTGLTLNGHTVNVKEQVRLAGNAAGSILNIDPGSTVTAGQFWTGNAASNSSTVNQTGGSVTVSGEVRIGHNATETSTWNMDGGTLTLSGTPTGNPYFTSGTNEDVLGPGTLYVGLDGQGLFQHNSGIVTCAALVLDNRSNTASGTNMTTGIDTYNLAGGTLVLGSATSAWGIQGNATSQFNFAGGILVAGGNLTSTLPLNVAAPGSTLDTNGSTVTLKAGLTGTSSLTLADGSGSGTGKVVLDLATDTTIPASLTGNVPVTKTGAGTLTLSGASTYTGLTTVNAGALKITGSLSGSNVVIDGGALHSGGSMVGDLALSPTVNSGLIYTGTPLMVTGNASLANITSIYPFSGGVTSFANGTYTLVNCTGSVTGVAGNLTVAGAASYRQSFAASVTASSIDLVVSGGPETLVWDGSVNTTWDLVATSAWKNSSLGADVFYQADGVTFDDNGVNGAVTLTGTLQPSAVLVNNSAMDYTFSGTGSISGPVALTKQGSAKLTLGNTNALTSGASITVSGGTLAVTASGALGAAPVVVGGGSLVDIAVPSATTAGTGAFTVSSGTLHVTTDGGLPAASTITLGNASSGTDETILEYPVNATTTGDKVVLSCPIIVSSAAPGSKAILRFPGGSSGAAASHDGTITLQNRDVYLQNRSITNPTNRLFNETGKITGTGNVHIDNEGAAARVRLRNAANDWVGHLYIDRGMVQTSNGGGASVDCVPNGANVYFAAGTRLGIGSTAETVGALNGGAADPDHALAAAWVSPNTSGGSPTLTIGANNADGVYDGQFTDESTHVFSLTKSGTGTQTLNGASTHTGTNTITGGTLALGNNAALGTGAINLNVATGAIRSADATARTIANPITYSTDFTLGSPTTGDLLFTGTVNVGGLNKTFNVQNAVTEFSGVMSGSGTPTRTKNGPGTLVLSGANTYPGTTIVNAGTLLVNNATGSGTGTSNVTVNAGGTLGGYGAISGTVSVAGGTLSPGASIESLDTGTLTLDSASTTVIEFDSSAVPPFGDRISVTGDVTLAGALSTLDVATTPVGMVGTKLTIITYTGSLSGAFAGLPEEAVFASGSHYLKIRYHDGNAVTLEAVSASSPPYTTWATTNGLNPATDGAPDADPDKDGLPNAIEFLFGSSPTAATTGGRPTATVSGGNMVFTFKRTDASEAYALVFETSTTLGAGSWGSPIPIPASTTPPVTVVENGTDPDDITVTVPVGTDPKKFGHLSLTITD